MAAPLIILADDHPLFRSALQTGLASALPGARLLEAESLGALRAAVEAEPQADLILLDLDMPGVQGFSSLLWLRSEHPGVPVVMLSGNEDPAVMRRALDLGASGYIPKSAELSTIAGAIRAVLDGGLWSPPAAQLAAVDDAERALAHKLASLSPQQLRVLTMLADGRLNKQIAFELGVTEATVKAHVTAVLRKLGLFRRTQAAVLAQRLMRPEAASLKVDDVAGGPEDET